LPRWKALSTDEKKAWVKQLKDDLKTGKKVAIREKGKVVAYKVKDRKTIRNEDMREELYKKVNNL
jgi:sortase (surface protein transpeptidase)